MGLRRNATTRARTRTGARNAAATYLAAEARRDVDLLQHALHDPVTGLPERALLLDRMALALARARRAKGDVAVLLLTMGTPTDRLLREVAERVLRELRDTDTVARFGPGELAVLCDGVDDRDTLEIVAGRVAAALATFDVGMEIVLADGDTPPVALLDLAERAARAR